MSVMRWTELQSVTLEPGATHVIVGFGSEWAAKAAQQALQQQIDRNKACERLREEGRSEDAALSLPIDLARFSRALTELEQLMGILRPALRHCGACLAVYGMMSREQQETVKDRVEALRQPLCGLSAALHT